MEKKNWITFTIIVGFIASIITIITFLSSKSDSEKIPPETHYNSYNQVSSSTNSNTNYNNSAKPNTEKIKRDLLGRKITEQPNGYHQQGWYWEIKEGEIKEIQIISENKQGNDYVFEVRLILQANGVAHEAFINLTYVLRQNNWTIDFLESKQVNIVRTGKFDNCVVSQRKGWSGEYYLELTNRCDVALVVGGALLSEFGGEWKKFSKIVSANETSSVGGLFSVSVGDYQIHFVERP